MRFSPVIAAALLGCPGPCAPDAGSNGGSDGGVLRCWASAGTVFVAVGPPSIASIVLRDGGPCFSTAASYRLLNPLDGGIEYLSETEGNLRAQAELTGIFELEAQGIDESWIPIQRLYFARGPRGWLVGRTCLRGEPMRDGFSCDGRLQFEDGGAGPAADEWLNAGVVVYGLRDGGIVSGPSPELVTPFVAQPEDVVSWDGDEHALVTLSTQNAIRLFQSDGGRTELALAQDAGVGNVFRYAGRTFFSRSSARWGGEICEVSSPSDAGCEPGYLDAVVGDVAWGASSIGGGDWTAIGYRYTDGGWRPDDARRWFRAPPGWVPAPALSRAIPGGLTVTSPDRRRVLVWQGVREDRHDLLLFELASPLVAAGVRSSVAWVSWDGGTLVAR